MRIATLNRLCPEQHLGKYNTGIINKFYDIFDVTIGKWDTENVDIGSKPDSNPSKYCY